MLAPARYDGRDRILLAQDHGERDGSFGGGFRKREGLRRLRTKGTRSCTGGVALMDKDFEYVVRGNKKLKIEPNASQAVSHDETRRRRGLTVWRGRVPSITGEDFVPFRVGIVLFLDKGIAGSRPSSGQEVPKVGSRMTVNGAEVLRYSQSRTARARQAQEHAHGGRSLSNSNRCLASSTGKGF